MQMDKKEVLNFYLIKQKGKKLNYQKEGKIMLSEILLLVLLILLNGFFAASEIAFISLNDARIEKQAKEGNKKAKSIKKC